MARRSGLGRGLDALIPPAVSHPNHSALRDVSLSSIRPNPHQPRKRFEEESLSSLVDSIKAIGVLQPVLVREVGPDEYELIAGERRWRASRRAGLQSIPVLVQVADDVSSLEQALVENLHREDLNALDEAAAYQQLIEEFHLTHEEVARRVGKSRAAITNSLRLFQLPPAVQRLLRDGKITPGHARALLTSPDRELQDHLAHEAATEGLSVRALEETIRAYAHDDTLGAVAHPAEAGGRDTPLAAREPASGAPSRDDGSPRAAVRRSTGLRPPGVLELEELLASHLDTRVHVEMGARRGRIVVEFATVEDLERIYRAMSGT